MTTKEFIKKLNESKIRQTDWLEDIEFEDSEMQKFFDASKVLKERLNRDEHRWYELSITVFQGPDGGIFGINSITQLYSEGSSLSDIYYHLQAYEMEEITTVSYTIKSEK